MRGGCDQGFCIVYSKLSYRRKFLRTIWMAVAGVLVAAGIWVLKPEARAPAVVFLIAIMAVSLAQATYNYRQWHAERQVE